MKKIAFILVAVFSIVGLSAYTTANVSDYEDVSEEYFEFDGQWKNLKVLPQDISKDSLMGLMRMYNQALGVKCNHCHVQDKASDEKHEKEITRHMIQFTDELNAKEFAPIGPKYAQAIECATCHRGATKVMEETNAFKTKE
jgi:hypothetical protein